MDYRKALYYVILTAIVLLSFFLYSSRYYPLLNSDDALNVLMAHYYQLPNDFYCWGQDRGGTLIPLISQVFIKIFGCSALMAVSLSNYLLLVLGYLGLSSLIKSRYYKVIFAIIWFLPFQRFIDLTRFPIGVEYSLLGIAVFLICKIHEHSLNDGIKKHFLLVLTVLVLILSVWVSDVSLVTIAILLFVLMLFYYVGYKSVKIDKTVVFYVIAGVVACWFFIDYAKSFVESRNARYLIVNDMGKLKTAFMYLGDIFADVLFFKTGEVFVSVYTYLAIVFIVCLTVFLFRKKARNTLIFNKWMVFFAIDTIVIFVVVMLSSWVLASHMARRYFVATYISLSMTVVLILDNLGKCSKILRYGVLVLALVGAVSPVYTMKYVNPKRLTPMADVVGEFRQLGKIGVIANYWNAYRTSCPDPDMVVATPHDKSFVRNTKLVEMVFERDDIYVIRDSWMPDFSDTLRQFGHILTKVGEPFVIGDCDVCKYEKTE